MSSTTRLIPLALTLVGALALAGCGDDSDLGSAGVTTSSTPTAGTTESTSPSDATASPTDGEVIASGDPVFDAAIRTAESAVQGRLIVSYDLDEDDDRIDVTVVGGDVEYELALSADGTQILSEEESDETLDGDELSEVRETTVPMREAVATALEQTAGKVEEVDLDRDDDVLRWEIEIRTDSGSTDVNVDATTGDTVG